MSTHQNRAPDGHGLGVLRSGRDRGSGRPRPAFELASPKGFEPGCDSLLTLVSGCGAALADAATGPDVQLAMKVRDVSEFLADIELPAAVELAPLARNVAVQDPCTLRNVLRAERGVYRLLERIPGIRLAPLPENHLCCGGAGVYPLREPQMAERLRAAKLDHLAQLNPDVLVSANLGCVLHLRAGLVDQGRVVEIVHPIVLFDRQLRARR